MAGRSAQIGGWRLFTVAKYSQADAAVKVCPPELPQGPGGLVSVPVQARLLTGTPLARAKLNYVVARYPWNWRPGAAREPGWTGWWRPECFMWASGQSITDEEGQATIRFQSSSRVYDWSRPHLGRDGSRYVVHVAMQESSGQVTVGSGSVLVPHRRTYLELTLDAHLAAPGEWVTARLRVQAADDQPLTPPVEVATPPRARADDGRPENR